MNIHEFQKRFQSDQLVPAEKLCDRWERQKELDDFLGMEIASGYMAADLLNGDGSLDQISPELREGFAALMGDKADSYHEIRQQLFEKLERGDRSVLGTVNKIKGQVGENRFLNTCASNDIPAKLAESGSQPGWDIAVDQPDGTTQYVQVKMYDKPGPLVSKLEELQAKIDAGEIKGASGETVTDIDIAVSNNIDVDALNEKLAERGLNFDIIPMESSAEEVADVVHSGFDNVGPEALENFFGELFGAALTTTALHSLVGAFLVYKKAKTADQFLSGLAESSSVSLAGLSSGMGVELILNQVAWVGGVPTYAFVFVSSFTVRAVAKRMLKRGSSVAWLSGTNGDLDALILRLEAA